MLCSSCRNNWIGIFSNESLVPNVLHCHHDEEKICYHPREIGIKTPLGWQGVDMKFCPWCGEKIRWSDAKT
jgi:hypothetical protein